MFIFLGLFFFYFLLILWEGVGQVKISKNVILSEMSKIFHSLPKSNSSKIVFYSTNYHNYNIRINIDKCKCQKIITKTGQFPYPIYNYNTAVRLTVHLLYYNEHVMDGNWLLYHVPISKWWKWYLLFVYLVNVQRVLI